MDEKRFNIKLDIRIFVKTESGDSLSEAMLTKLVKWKLRDEILHG
jgi:hypothetical protein